MGLASSRSFKVGDVHKYKMTGKFELGGMEYEYSATSTQKILKVDASGSWTQKEDVSDIKLNGEEPPGGAGPGGATTTFSAKATKCKVSRRISMRLRIAAQI